MRFLEIRIGEYSILIKSDIYGNHEIVSADAEAVGRAPYGARGLKFVSKDTRRQHAAIEHFALKNTVKNR